jgi:hypothetical protein
MDPEGSLAPFIRAFYLSLSWARWIQSMPPHPISLRSILILSPIYGWVFQLISFLQVFHQTLVYTPTPPHTRYMPRPSHYSRFYHPNNISRVAQIIKFLVMYFFPLPFYLVPRPKYSSTLPHMRYMHHPSHSSRFYHPNNISWGAHLIKFLIM